MPKSVKIDYLAKVNQLSKEEKERLFSRMRGKLDNRLEKRKITQEEALAKQLELEDEQLFEWRKMMLTLREKEKAKGGKKAKADTGNKTGEKKKADKPKSTAVKAGAKVKSGKAAKSKAAVKTRATAGAQAE